MNNATVMAGQGSAIPRRLLVRMAAAAAGLTLAVTVILALLQRTAEAQIPGANIACAILLAVANFVGGLFGGIFAGIINALLAAFGCGISG
jgi:hypothetical protein